MSWTSTAEYYRLLNEGVATRMGGLHSARLLLHSVDFAPVAELQHAGDWDGAARWHAVSAAPRDDEAEEGNIQPNITKRKEDH